VRALVITKLFPNAVEPLSSPFNRQQFAALRRLCDVEVLATIPWFPGASYLRRWSAAGRAAAVPRRDTIDGLTVRHPRVLYLPKLASLSPALYAGSLLPEVLPELLRRRFDVILGSWGYPDGVAAVTLGRLLSRPVVVKLHGSDIDVLAERRGPRAGLRWALPRAARVVAVSRPLARAAERLGAAPDRIEVIRNGVDGELFHPRPRQEARLALGHPGDGRRWLVAVSRLERDKGSLDTVDAFARLARQRDDVALVLVGDGAAREECQRRIAAYGIVDRVILPGARPLAEIPLWMNAAHAVVLASHHEGTPNVVLEALACGRRVVASAVGGIPDLLSDPTLGEVVPPGNHTALSAALARAASAAYDPQTVAARSQTLTWAESAAHLHGCLTRAAAQA
jgi:teichuronic acid biosynthesis glycosyltransferase TuaC